MVLHSLKSGRAKYRGGPQGLQPTRTNSFRLLCTAAANQVLQLRSLF